MKTCSDRHSPIMRLVTQLSGNCKSIDQLAGLLKQNNIPYEKFEIMTGTELLVFTGSSGYDITGFSIKRINKEFIIEEF